MENQVQMPMEEIGREEMGSENQQEKVLAVLTNAATPDASLLAEVRALSVKAGGIRIIDKADYEAAAQIGRDIKAKKVSIEEFFKPFTQAADQAHKLLVAGKNKALAPLNEAETKLKSSMGAYLQEQERLRRKIEEEQRRIAQEEANRKLKEAQEEEARAKALADHGKAQEAQEAQEKADEHLFAAAMADSASRELNVVLDKPKASGVYQRMVYRITGINPAAVPVEFNGAMLRPVDESAVMALIKASKGAIKIPGITYVAFPDVSIRK